jgi:hypothetical protein
MTNKELLSEIAKEFDNYRNGVKEEFVVMKKETEEDRKQAIANAMQETLLQKNLSDVKKDKQYDE